MRTYRRDLDRAGAPIPTAEGQLDLGALRSGFATLLRREGVPLALAQRLMRHSTPALTSAVYTRLNLGDVRGGPWTRAGPVGVLLLSGKAARPDLATTGTPPQRLARGRARPLRSVAVFVSATRPDHGHHCS